MMSMTSNNLHMGSLGVGVQQNLRHAFGNPSAAVVAEDKAPGVLGVSGNALCHVVAVEAQVRQQLRVEAAARVTQPEHELPRGHACCVPHLQVRVISATPSQRSEI